MRRFLALVALFAGCGTPSPGDAAPDITELIEQLGDADISLREEAMNRLLASGERVVARLVAVVEGHPDIEVRARAARVVCRLRQDRDVWYRKSKGLAYWHAETKPTVIDEAPAHLLRDTFVKRAPEGLRTHCYEALCFDDAMFTLSRVVCSVQGGGERLRMEASVPPGEVEFRMPVTSITRVLQGGPMPFGSGPPIRRYVCPERVTWGLGLVRLASRWLVDAPPLSLHVLELDPARPVVLLVLSGWGPGEDPGDEGLRVLTIKPEGRDIPGYSGRMGRFWADPTGRIVKVRLGDDVWHLTDEASARRGIDR